jgi:glycosyltransferase involved in cell wall biosynthesis
MPEHICILSSVHFTFDVRMFQAEARTLSNAGFKVTVVALEDQTIGNAGSIEVIPLPVPKNRLRRMLATARVLRLALRQKADAYVFHDPELIPVCLMLKMLTDSILVYDVHEDVPESIRSKKWVPLPLRACMAWLYRVIEVTALRFFDGVTLADHAYARYYGATKSLVVLNYPLLSYADYNHPAAATAAGPLLVYTGSITVLRGLFEMLALVRDLKPEQPGIRLDLVGPVGSPQEERQARALVRQYGIDENVNFTGVVSHAEVHRRILAADVGLALLHPDPNYMRSLPTKMFEYMMMGKAVVVSDFPLWQQILDDTECGIAVDPLSPTAPLEAVKRLLGDAAERNRMGTRGRQAVLAKYNWDCQGPALVGFYKSLLAAGAR